MRVLSMIIEPQNKTSAIKNKSSPPLIEPKIIRGVVSVAAVFFGAPDADTTAVGVRVTEPNGIGLDVDVDVDVTDGPGLAVAEPDGSGLGVDVPEAPGDAEGLRDGVRVAVLDGDGVGVLLGLPNSSRQIPSTLHVQFVYAGTNCGVSSGHCCPTEGGGIWHVVLQHSVPQ